VKDCKLRTSSLNEKTTCKEYNKFLDIIIDINNSTNKEELLLINNEFNKIIDDENNFSIISRYSQLIDFIVKKIEIANDTIDLQKEAEEIMNDRLVPA
jgi:hypothetical protein